MTCDTQQRLAVSALIASVEKLAIPRMIGVIATVLERDIAEVKRAFGAPTPRLVVVGDHSEERFNAIQDAVSNAMQEGDYLPSPNPAFPEMER